MNIDCPKWKTTGSDKGGFCVVANSPVSIGTCNRCLKENLKGLHLIIKSAKIKGLGDVIAKVATPVARALKLDCIDPVTKQLKPDSGCSKRKEGINKRFPFKQ